MSGQINDQTFELLMTELKDIKQSVDVTQKDVKDGFGKLNGRVRKLENWRWYIVGIATAIVFIVNRILK